VIDAATLAARDLTLRAACVDDAAFERILFESARPDRALLSAALPRAALELFLDQQFHFQTAYYARAYPKAAHLIVLAKDIAVGRLILDCGARNWRVVDIALLPQARGKGFGAALLRGVLNAAARAAAPSVSLTVELANPARRLYEQLGFVVVEETPSGAAMEWRPPNAQLKTA